MIITSILVKEIENLKKKYNCPYKLRGKFRADISTLFTQNKGWGVGGCMAHFLTSFTQKCEGVVVVEFDFHTLFSQNEWGAGQIF